MCMKNVNAICKLYSEKIEENGIVDFKNPFNKIIIQNGDFNSINKFYAVSDFFIMGTERNEFNFINNKTDLKVLIRITKMSSDKNKQESYIFDSYNININDTTIQNDACAPFISFTITSEIDLKKAFNIIKYGEYVVKILLQNIDAPTEEKDKWELQSFARFSITDN